MEKFYSILQLVLMVVLPYMSYRFGRAKSKAETANLEIKTELEEVELSDKVIEFYKKQMAELLKSVEHLTKEVEELKKIVELKDSKVKELVTLTESNQCTGDLCPTKIEYNKIMTKKANQKAARLRKKNSEVKE